MGVTRDPSFTGCSATCSWFFDAQQPAHVPMVCILIYSLLFFNVINKYSFGINAYYFEILYLSLSLSLSQASEEIIVIILTDLLFVYYIYDL